MKLLWVILLAVLVCAAAAGQEQAAAQGYDVRGQWVGNAKGPVFGAEGTVHITRQEGSRIQGMVEGGNFLGKARFAIDGWIQGNRIYGGKEGMTFDGYLYADGTIRGRFKGIDGETYRVFLKRPYPTHYWGYGPYQRTW